MSSEIRYKDRFLIRIGAIGWFILATLFFISLPIVFAAAYWLVLLAVILGSLLAVPLYFIARRFSAKVSKVSYFKSAIALSMVLVFLLAAPVFYFAYVTEADPLVLPQATLSDGDKQVVFQGMVHVGSEAFYKSVVYDLEQALVNDYDLFYEGVQPGDAESDAWFAQALSGGQDLSENYQALADVCGVKFQLNYFTLLAKQQEEQPQRHITADVTTRQMLDQWHSITADNPELSERFNQEKVSSSDTSIVQWMQAQGEERKKIGGIFCRALLTITLSHPSEKKPLSPVILDFRNKYLAQKIAEHNGNKIYVTYGAAHLPGLIEALEQLDPAWELQSVKWTRALATEREYTGDASLFIP